MKLLILLVLSLFLSACSNGHHGCEALTGTWMGTVNDPAQLFGDGGPWKIKMTFHYHQGRFYGRSYLLNVKGGVVPPLTGQVWGSCKLGRLTNVLMIPSRTTQVCGAASDTPGPIGNDKTLTLPIHWESAMTGTTFIAKLKRVNDRFEAPMPKTMVAPVIHTCH